MRLETISDHEDLNRIEGQWNALLERSENRDVLHSHQWYSCWSASFVQSCDMLILVAREEERLRAVLPLMKQSYRTKGLAIKAVKSMTNSRSGAFDLLSDRPSPELLGALLARAFEATNRRMMILEKIRQNSLILKYIDDASKGNAFLYLTRPVTEGWQVRIEAPFETFFDGRESKFRKNMRAAERKALDRGPLTVLQPSGPEDLDSYLDRGFALQSNGWKGRQGSAVMQDDQVRTFYRNLAVRGFETGWLRYMLLASNGDDISFMYCLGAFGAIHALEIGMDERFKNIGAGMVVTKKMLEQTFREKQFGTWDFGNGQDRWKRDWCNGRELEYDVLVFRKDPLGVLLYALARYYDFRHPFHPIDPSESRKRNAGGMQAAPLRKNR